MRTPTPFPFKSKSRPLTPEETQEFGRRVDEIRETVMNSLGPKDAAYIYKVRNFVRVTEITSRTLLMFGGWLPPVWILATGMLGVSKIVENMELGHNVIHGQYDWLNDPSLSGATYEWDTVCTSEDWKYTHNYIHHTYTNVIGRDHDIGYGAMRMTREQAWEPRFLFNVPIALVLSTGFQWLLSLQRFELADSSTRCNKDEPGDGWLRMSRHHGRLNRQVQVARCTSTSAEKNDTKFTAS